MGAGDRALLGAGGGAGDGLVHDAADGASASSTLRTAPEAAVDLVGRGRTRRGVIKRGPHVTVAENVAGTNDHRGTYRHPGSTNLDLSHARASCKKKNALLSDSKVLIRLALIAFLLNGRAALAPKVSLSSALLPVSQVSSTTRLLSVPISGTEMSTTSPALSQRGGSKRAPAPTGVPVTMMSPGFRVVKIVM